jgi:hypothetical protein
VRVLEKAWHRRSAGRATCLATCLPGLVAGMLVGAGLGPGRPLAARQPEALAAAPWRLEAIELADGRRLEGLVLGPDGVAGTPPHDCDDIEFLQIVRPAGRPLHLVTWPAFPARSVRFVERQLPEERDRLRARVVAFREERRRQGDLAAVRLRRRGEGGPWISVTPAFVLESSADPSLTQEAVVRLGLIFDALENLVPPVAAAEPVTIRLCGSAAEYREVQESLGLRLDNPAFYLPGRRLLVAGSELPALLEEQGVAEDILLAARQRHLDLSSLLEPRLRELAADLEGQGLPPQERAEIVKRARGRAGREQAEEIARIEATRRANAAVVERARRAFHQRLAHEAWHAYADGRLRPAEGGGLPAWLDEGLAQVVETAFLEGGELRLDAPDPRRLARLQEAIAAGGLRPVAEIVSAGQEAFVGGHRGDEGLAYLAAWGLAFDLAVLRPVLSAANLRALAAADAADPIVGLERLVGMPVDRYDRQWRERMSTLRSQPRGDQLSR